mmetsp:Transcript_44071/g.143012  ORF Transcript_44071/g.143012 Transcript_44071/m.143012 type:complete len:248 (-) Transcript_44071:181-924(-)
MERPLQEKFNFERDFEFKNYIHVLYKKDDFIDLEADEVSGIRSWRLTQGGTSSRAVGRGGAGGGLGYSFRSQPNVCFCAAEKCAHGLFTGESTPHTVLACTQQKTDREQATDFFGTIDKGMPLASKGDLLDSTAGGELVWFAVAKGKIKVADAPFRAAGGTTSTGTRTIATNWAYVDVEWLNKIKADSEGNVHLEAWAQPHGERTVLTKPKILTVPTSWLREYQEGGRARYVLSASDYQRLVDAVRR